MKKTVKYVILLGAASALSMSLYDERQDRIREGKMTAGDEPLFESFITVASIPARLVRACARHASDFLDSDEAFARRHKKSDVDIDIVG